MYPHQPLARGSDSDDEREYLRSTRSSSPQTPKLPTGPSDAYRWAPGVSRRFPWIGVIGLSFVLIGMGLETAILRLSDHQIVANWPTPKYKIRPNVLINLANQISSLGLLTAVYQGLEIAWWRKAIHGSSIAELHRSHSYSTSFLATLMAGKHFNLIALAALMAKMPIIDSTLFQQATRTGMQYLPDYHNATIQAWIDTTWPQGVGGIPGTDGETRTVDVEFADVIKAFNSKFANDKVHDTETLFLGCPPGQLCTGELEAFGFGFDCETEISQIDYAVSLKNHTAVSGEPSPVYPLWSVDFATDWATEWKSWASINLTMTYVNTVAGPYNTCPGTMTKRTCIIRPAVVQYPVSVLAGDSRQSVNVTHLGFSNNASKPYPFNSDMRDPQIDGLQVLRYTNLDEHKGNISTVAGITFALNNLFQSSANITWTKDWDLSIWGSRAQSEFSANSTAQISQQCNYKLDHTDQGVADPFIYILRQVNTFAFISALYVSGVPHIPHAERQKSGFPSRPFDTSVSGYVDLYQTNNNFLAAGILTTLLTLLGVLPVYYGFWQLGRKVSLEPIEIANAFDAPIFERARKRNGDVDSLLEEVGKVRVRYGWLNTSSTGGKGQLGFAEPADVVGVDEKGGDRVSQFLDLKSQVREDVELTRY